MSDAPEGHLEFHPVSLWTYRKYGCRCDGCRALSTAAAKEQRRKNGYAPSHIVQRKAHGRAAAWLRANRPDVWRQLVEDAWNEVQP